MFYDDDEEGEEESEGEARPFWHAVALAAVPAIISEVGAGVREWLHDRREAQLARELPPCEHGRPGGRLCAPCSEAREHEEAKAADDEEDASGTEDGEDE